MTHPVFAEQQRVRPVWMEVQREGGQAVIAILAASDHPTHVTVELEVVGGSKLHTKTRAVIEPDRPPVVLSRASIEARHPWKARLSVTAGGDEPYTFEQSDGN